MIIQLALTSLSGESASSATRKLYEVKLSFPKSIRSQKTTSSSLITMSLQIPHREKANGASAATKAVILVRSAKKTCQKG